MIDIRTVYYYEQYPAKLSKIRTPNSSGIMFSNDNYKFVPYSGQPYVIDEVGGIRRVSTEKDKSSEISRDTANFQRCWNNTIPALKTI